MAEICCPSADSSKISSPSSTSPASHADSLSCAVLSVRGIRFSSPRKLSACSGCRSNRMLPWFRGGDFGSLRRSSDGGASKKSACHWPYRCLDSSSPGAGHPMGVPDGAACRWGWGVSAVAGPIPHARTAQKMRKVVVRLNVCTHAGGGVCGLVWYGSEVHMLVSRSASGIIMWAWLHWLQLGPAERILPAGRGAFRADLRGWWPGRGPFRR